MPIAMSPEGSPDQVKPLSGVRRANNVPLYILGAVALVFLLVMAMEAMDRSNAPQNEADKQQEDTRTSSMMAEMIVGKAKERRGITQSPQAEPPYIPSENHRINIAIPENRDLPPVVSRELAASDNLVAPIQQDPNVERIRQQKIQLFEKAVQSGTNIDNIPASRSAGSPPNQTPGRHEALQRLADVRRQVADETDPSTAYDGGYDDTSDGDSFDALGGDGRSADNDVGQFNKTGQGDRWRLDSQTKAPRSPFTLQTGFVMPATLISGINSELPGQIIAQVSQDIYDSPVGEYKLIPQGSRLVGAYSSDIVFGQGRLLVAWQRIIFPDGKTRDIGAMPGSSGAGYAGFADKVNNHYFRIFGSALLMSAVIAGATYSQRDAGGGNNGFGRQSAGSVLSQSLGQQLGRVTTLLMRKNLNIAPTLEIRPGYRFNVIVTKDLVFKKPYQAFDY